MLKTMALANFLGCLFIFLFVSYPLGVKGHLKRKVDSRNTFNVIALLPAGSRSGPRNMAAQLGINFAYHYIKMYKILNFNLTLQSISTGGTCSAIDVVKPLMKLLKYSDSNMIEPRLDVVIGGQCSSQCEQTALITSSIDVPFISTECTAPSLNNKQLFPTLSRITVSWSSVDMIVGRLFNEFTWKNVILMCEDTFDMRKMSRDVEMEILRYASNKKPIIMRHTTGHFIYKSKIRIENLKKAFLIQETVIVLLTLPEYAVTIIKSIYDIQLADYHMIIALDMMHEILPKNNYLDPKEKQRFNDAFEKVVIISLATPYGKRLNQFIAKIDRNSKKYRDDFANMFRIVIHYYNAVLIWATCMNKTIAKHPNLRKESTKEVKHGYYSLLKQSISGLKVEGASETLYLNKLGDYEPEISVSIVLKGKSEQFYIYKNTRYLNESFDLKMVFNKTKYLRDMPELMNTKLNLFSFFSKGRPENRKSLKRYQVWICSSSMKCDLPIGLSFISLMCLLFALVYCSVFYRGSMKYMSFGIKSLMSTPDSVEWFELENNNQYNDNKDTVTVFNSMHKNTALTVSMVKARNSIDVDSGEVANEIYKIKSIRHPNMNRFYAVVPEAPYLCVLMEKCKYGTLKKVIDQLRNDLKDDWKFSFCFDIIKGLQYLHRSSIESHGYLTTESIHVDYTFRCQITDYGLAEFRSGDYKTKVRIFDVNPKVAKFCKLWLAPELLRVNPVPACGNKASDIYAYALVCNCIFTSKEPFMSHLRLTSIDDILLRIINPIGGHIMRPDLKEISNSDLNNELVISINTVLERAWDENPICRPTSDSLETYFRTMMIFRNGVETCTETSVRILKEYSMTLEFKVNELRREQMLSLMSFR